MNLLAATFVLAVEDDQVKPGLIGFVVVVGMAVALYFLLRSMAKHLRRVDVGDSGPDDGELDPRGQVDSPDGTDQR